MGVCSSRACCVIREKNIANDKEQLIAVLEFQIAGALRNVLPKLMTGNVSATGKLMPVIGKNYKGTVVTIDEKNQNCVSQPIYPARRLNMSKKQ